MSLHARIQPVGRATRHNIKKRLGVSESEGLKKGTIVQGRETLHDPILFKVSFIGVPLFFIKADNYHSGIALARKELHRRLSILSNREIAEAYAETSMLVSELRNLFYLPENYKFTEKLFTLLQELSFQTEGKIVYPPSILKHPDFKEVHKGKLKAAADKMLRAFIVTGPESKPHASPTLLGIVNHGRRLEAVRNGTYTEENWPLDDWDSESGEEDLHEDSGQDNGSEYS